MSVDTRSKVIFLPNLGVPVSKIKKLQDLGVVSRKSIYLLLQKYQVTCSLADRKRKSQGSFLNTEHMEFIDQAIDANRVLTSLKLRNLIVNSFPHVQVSLATIKRAWKVLGWTTKKTRYCAIINDINKEKQMTWCIDRIANDDMDMTDVIWSDESTIEMEPHQKMMYQKKGLQPHYAAIAKHPLKVHVWGEGGGISSRGQHLLQFLLELLLPIDILVFLMQPCSHF